MIKLLIKNRFQKMTEEDLKCFKEEAEHTQVGCVYNPFYLKEYDKEKWRNGRIYEFNTLKEIKEFYNEAEEEIDYTKEHSDTFSEWTWQVIDITLDIDTSEDNFMVLRIDAYDEWRD